MNKHFEIVIWEDDSIGQGYELFWEGNYVGTSGSIAILRRWARNIWQFGFV